MADLNYTVLAALPIMTWCLYALLQRWRSKFNHIPNHFPNSLLWGNLKVIGDGYKELDNQERHPDYIFENLWREKGYPQFLFLDLRPINYATLVICNHDIAEQVSRATSLYPYSVTKSPTVQAGLGSLIGPFSILTAEDEAWKGLRKRFNNGFAPQHLFSLTPVIVEKTAIFMSKLDALAESGAEFDMETLCTNVTFDIIGKIVTNLDFKAQDEETGGNDIVRNFKRLVETYNAGGYWLYLNIGLRIKRYIASKRTDVAIKKCITDKFAQIKGTQALGTKKDRSVLALALKDTDELTPDILQSTADNVKTFLFAGHDTTSVLLQWLTYTLSTHPECLRKMRAEHDAIFGDKDPKEAILARPEETMKAMQYTSACIKEALRLYPPAGTARYAFGTGFKVRTEDGAEVCLDNTVLYTCHYLIQRDPRVFGETANDFIPERWTGDIDTSAARKDEEGTANGENKIPISAWRPFERGPRNCIGQELSNIEARVILACIVRRYDFTKVGAGELELNEKGRPILDEKGRYKTKTPLFNAMIVTSKPFDKCRMRVKRHEANA